MKVLCVGLMAMWCAGAAKAQDTLLPGEVAQSAAAFYPEVLAATAERQSALARRQSADGAFDTVVETELRARLEGFYSGDFADVRVRKPLGPLGAEIFGGYRVSQGDYPIYEDIFFTNQDGEGKVGVLFSLLRGRAIDSRRAGVARADLGITEADLDLLLTRIEVKQSALTAYWAWVARARELAAYEELLDLAQRQDQALRKEVAAGARARIFLTENAQNLTRRQELVRRAERDLSLAANRLSLFLRSEDGTPIIPIRAQLPESVPLPSSAPRIDPQALFSARPDLRLLEVAKDQLEIDRQLARNDLLPKLDAAVEASNDFGRLGPGGISRDDPEFIAGLQLTVPIGRREARGRLRTAEAELQALEQRERLLRDQIARELSDIIITLNTARDVLALTRQETEQAEIMRVAELDRFRGGASDFFLVNLREQAAANAKVRLAQAEFAYASANVAFQAATLDTERLLRGY
ncbi:MAG: TolC family protein [Pseudomonadota bacterium]